MKFIAFFHNETHVKNKKSIQCQSKRTPNQHVQKIFPPFYSNIHSEIHKQLTIRPRHYIANRIY